MTNLALTSFGTDLNAAVIGASGGIGGAFVDHLAESQAVAQIVGLSRSAPATTSDRLSWHRLDLEDEESIDNEIRNGPQKLYASNRRRGIDRRH